MSTVHQICKYSIISGQIYKHSGEDRPGFQPPSEQFSPLQSVFRRRLLTRVGAASALAVGINFGGVTSFLLGFSPEAARTLKLDAFYPVGGYSRYIDTNEGFATRKMQIIQMNSLSKHNFTVLAALPSTSSSGSNLNRLSISFFHPKTSRRRGFGVSCSSFRTTAAARDRVIDFGKYKGRMLGSVPSSYLKWVSKNLRAGDSEEWAKLADEVLEDPVYRDRIEWEFAESILSGGGGRGTGLRGGAVSELVEISERFGWDNEDKDGWRKIDFGLLGTSKGGRIPRKETGGRRSVGTVGSWEKKKKPVEEERNHQTLTLSEGRRRRDERRERLRQLKAKSNPISLPRTGSNTEQFMSTISNTSIDNYGHFLNRERGIDHHNSRNGRKNDTIQEEEEGDSVVNGEISDPQPFSASRFPGRNELLNKLRLVRRQM